MFWSKRVCGLSTVARRLCSENHAEGGVRFPSDLATGSSTFNTRDQTRKSFRPNVDPSSTSVLLFPGQGSQFVGMGKKLVASRDALSLYDTASEIVNYDVLKLCLEGPSDELMRTDKCQVATLVTSIAALQSLQESCPQALESCVAAAGFSVGEYAAHVFAGTLSFEDAVELVESRGKEMQEEAEATDSALMTVFLSHSSKLNYAMKSAIEYCKVRKQIEHPVCEIANYLFPDVKVIGGNTEALAFIKTNLKEFGLKRVKFLPVSGAFHTRLMRPAAIRFKDKLLQTEFKRPVVPVHSNVHSGADTDLRSIKKHLISQIYSPVKWEQIMHTVYQRRHDTPFPQSYEVGPGGQLGTILKMVNNKAYQSYQAIEV
ncbi:malonyl-CoA-acyl carrier protein transacylase, mitochondrial-like [Watersipora subatra]|uniref:malonyl-CoA-acyl carrier protein transacylase, mitochondrial-like n=1 Tax=Watersipora subatra TaxID=2589382 RepID=UPI00355BAA6F